MSWLRVAVALTILGAVLTGLHRYFWARLVRDTALPAPWATVGARGLVVLAVLVAVALLAQRGPRALAGPIAFVAYTWLGLAWFLFVGLLVGDVAKGALRVARPGLPVDPERRVAFARIVAGAAALVAGGLGAAGVASVAARTRVARVRVALPKLGPGARYRIVQLTDVHVGPTIGKGFIEAIVEEVNRLDADAVVITGDLVDGTVDRLREHVAPLAGLRSREGTFFVTGNHEYYSGADAWIAHLATLGVRVLANERVSLAGAALDLAGVHDHASKSFPGHGEDVPKALAGRDAARAVVLLAHQPKTVLEAARHGVDLQLSGHTHGGQLFPFAPLVRLQQPYVSGLHVHEGTHLYVSNGTGYWGPPMRVGAPAEITLLQLEG